MVPSEFSPFLLQNILLEEHILIQNLTNNTREKGFLKKKKQLMDKYNSPLEANSQHSNYKTGSFKPPIFNLTTEEIPKHCELLLNLGPNVVSTSKKRTLYGHNNINQIFST